VIRFQQISIMQRLLILIAVLMFGSVVYSQTSELRIIGQPKPPLPKDYGQLDAQGSIVLKVEFLSTGKIGKVTLVSRLYPELDELAVEAARKIKFDPKIVNGKPIDQYKVVQYMYSYKFAGWRVPPIKRSPNNPSAPKR
jgi:TonB family protein